MKPRRIDIIREVITIALGLIGTIGCFLTTFTLPLSMPLLVIALSAVTFLIYYRYFTSRKTLWLRILASIYGLIVLMQSKIWRNGFIIIINRILTVYQENSQYTFTLIHNTLPNTAAVKAVTLALFVIFVPLVFVTVHSIRQKRHLLIAFSLSAFPIFLILLFTLRPHPVYFTMVLLYDWILFAMTKSKVILPAHDFRLYKGQSLALLALVLMIALRLMKPEASYIRSPYIEELRVQIQLALRDQNDNHAREAAGILDLTTVGNRFYRNITELEVTMEEPQALYLHGYSASVYHNNKWTQISEGRFHVLYPWEREHSVHPFDFTSVLGQKQLDTQDAKAVTITNRHANEQYLYVPYGTREALTAYPFVSDIYIDGTSCEKDNTFHIWPEAALNHLVDDGTIHAYETAMSETYLEVAADVRKTIASIEIPGMENADTDQQKIAFIQDYMLHFGTYSLSCGTTPSDSDFITYFLTESQSGYCVHYASAAVMLLRYYGIPARYASGYYVSPGAFQNGTAQVKDSAQHAWVEILNPHSGWQVLEVTPPTAAPSTIYHNPNTSPDSTAESTTENQPHNNPTHGIENTDNRQSTDTINKGWILSGVGIMAWAAVLGRRWFIKKRREKKQNDPLPQKAILAWAATLAAWDYDLTAIDPPLRSLIEEARFSNHPMSDQQRQQVQSECCRLIQEQRRARPFWQRWYDRYIRCID